MGRKRFSEKIFEKILQFKIIDISYLDDEKTIKTAYKNKFV